MQDGIKATVSLCGFILVFSMLLAVLHDAGIFQFLCGFLSRFGYTVPLSGALLDVYKIQQVFLGIRILRHH